MLGIAAWYEYVNASAFVLLLTAVIISAVIALIVCWSNARVVGATRKEMLLAMLSQLLSVAVTVFIIPVFWGLERYLEGRRK